MPCDVPLFYASDPRLALIVLLVFAEAVDEEAIWVFAIEERFSRKGILGDLLGPSIERVWIRLVFSIVLNQPDADLCDA